MEERKEKEKEERSGVFVWEYYFSLIFEKLGEQLCKSQLN